MSSIKKIKRAAIKKRLDKVIGYFAARHGTPYLLCDEDACVIGYTKENIKKYITVLANQSTDDYIIKKTTFGEIHAGMIMGGVYAFDEESYKVFLPLSKTMGMNLAEFKIEEDDQPPYPNAIRLMKIAWFSTWPEE